MRNITLLAALFFFSISPLSFAEGVFSIPSNLSLVSVIDKRNLVYLGKDGESWAITTQEVTSQCPSQSELQKEIDKKRVIIESEFRGTAEDYARLNVVHSLVRRELSDGAMLLALSHESMHYPAKELRTTLDFYIFWKNNSIAKGTLIWADKMEGKLQSYIDRLVSTKIIRSHNTTDEEMLRDKTTQCPSP